MEDQGYNQFCLEENGNRYEQLAQKIDVTYSVSTYFFSQLLLHHNGHR
jgi:hypothetical protein